MGTDAPEIGSRGAAGDVLPTSHDDAFERRGIRIPGRCCLGGRAPSASRRTPSRSTWPAQADGRGRWSHVSARRCSPSTSTLRQGLDPGDQSAIIDLLEATGFFNQDELAVALELVDYDDPGDDQVIFLKVLT
jgi:hypothetical protein